MRQQNYETVKRPKLYSIEFFCDELRRSLGN